jgi:chromosome segregation protein
VEQAILHHRESRQQQQQELARTEQTLGEIGQHIQLDRARLEELSASIAAIEPELLSARDQVELSGTELAAAEQAMRSWQSDWDEFNQRSAERMQAPGRAYPPDHLEKATGSAPVAHG